MADVKQLETPLSDAEFAMLQEFFRSEFESYLLSHRSSKGVALNLPSDIYESLLELADSMESPLAYPLRGLIAVFMPRLKMAAKLIRRCRYAHRFQAEVDPINANSIEHRMVWLLARLLETERKSKQRRGKTERYNLWLTPSRKKNLKHAALNHDIDLNRLIVTLLRLALREDDSAPKHHA